MQTPLDLPELLAHVFTHLPGAETLRAGEVCRAWHAVADEPSFWHSRFTDMFSVAPPQGENPKQAFQAGWAASRTTARGLMVPDTCRKPPKEMAQLVAPLARPHRLEVAQYLMQRLEDGLLVRLTRLGLESGIARAAACVHQDDKPTISAMGAAMHDKLASRSLPLPKPHRRERA